MPKYYVDAGDFRKVIDGADPKNAAVEAFRTLENNPVPTLSSITVVSETGYDTNNDNDWCFSTMDLLEQSDQLGNYKPDF
ncbi:hypothetical protein [Nitrospira sp. BLG_2]|uniref:hypothetical protein n=1 Tax=Nitrospira sp. BLG_2 TaxID=3397507 RepID=UPI003B9D74FE